MTTQNKREDWEERFNRKFGMAHGWDSKEFGGLQLSKDIKSFLATERAKAQEEIKDKIKMLIVEESNIAHSENQPTSRLTSLYNKVSELK